jgi:signal transduction histidine kinase/DNA-binding NarL/FixJ family response regulator
MDTPSPPELHGKLAAATIVAAYREKILYALAIIATVVLLPFGVYNLVIGYTLVAVTVLTVVAVFVADALAIHWGRRLPVPIPVAFALIVITLLVAIWQRGLLGIFWTFPAILLLHFILDRRLANAFNITLVALVGMVAFYTQASDVALRIVAAQLLTIVFTNIFSYVLEAEQAKEAEQRERLELLVRATRAGSYQWDRGAPAVIYSARMKEILGYPADADTSGWPPFQEFVHPEDREARYQLFLAGTRDRSVRNGVRPHIAGDYRLVKANGDIVWVHADGIFIHDDDALAVRYIASLIDVTERYRQGEDLRNSHNQIAVQAQQLRDQNETLRSAIRVREEVERIARHDLKTPLNSILSVPRRLRERRKPDAREDELLGMVEGAAYRILDLVNMSVDLYRMEQGEYSFSPRAVDLSGLVETVVREVRAHAQTKHVDIAMRIDGAAPAAGGQARVHVWGSELLCYSILANLIKNAVEASPEDGVVAVDFHAAAEEVVLKIHNSGVVPARVRDSFFEKYATSGKVGGFGLGTYSARLMAQVQSGDLQMCTSEAGGTTLTLRLPPVPFAAMLPGGAAAADSGPDVPGQPLPALRVLVVDDDEFNVTFMRHWLPSPPLEVYTAINGRAALDAARTHPPDVVFMDLEMPVMDGFEALARLRELEAATGARRSTVVAFSSYDDELIRRRCRSAGFDDYLGKPAARERIYAILHTAAAGPAAVPPAARGAGAPGPDDPVAFSADADIFAMLQKFFASRSVLLAELRAAIDAGDRAAAGRCAHKLAGSFALYGFTWAAAECRALQQDLARADESALLARCDQLQRHIESVRLAGHGGAAGGNSDENAGENAVDGTTAKNGGQDGG